MKIKSSNFPPNLCNSVAKQNFLYPLLIARMKNRKTNFDSNLLPWLLSGCFWSLILHNNCCNSAIKLLRWCDVYFSCLHHNLLICIYRTNWRSHPKYITPSRTLLHSDIDDESKHGNMEFSTLHSYYRLPRTQQTNKKCYLVRLHFIRLLICGPPAFPLSFW